MSTEDSESTDKTEHAQSTENAEAAGPVGRGRTADTPGRVALTRSERLRSQGSRGEAGRPFLRGLLTLIVVLAIIAIVRTLFVQSYTIPSGSMEDTLHAGDRILVTLYDTDSVQHGDVVVFTDPDHWLTDPDRSRSFRPGCAGLPAHPAAGRGAPSRQAGRRAPGRSHRGRWLRSCKRQRSRSR